MTLDPTTLSAAAAADLIRNGDLKSQELVAACLARIGEREETVQAWAYLDPEHAMAEARAADAARERGTGGGPLHGVPIGVKDIIDTADQPTECGSPACAGRRPTTDAAVVSALRAAGAIVIGKTVTTEFATRTPSRTRNPCRPDHTPGGSSAGSAAAVADRMVPAAIGTQTFGSVIRPASFCGVYGYKPTFGLLPRSGVLEQAPSLDTLGLMARSLADLALLADVLGVYDPDDPASLAISRPQISRMLQMDWPLAPTFAYVKGPAWTEADPSLHEAYGELVDALGGQVVEMDLTATMEEGLEAARIIHGVEMAAALGPLADRSPGLIDGAILRSIEEGRRLAGTDYVAALAKRRRHRLIVQEIFTNHGTILTPAAPGPAPRGLATTGDPVCNTFWTYLGTPAVTLPLLEADDMPLGVQLVGAPLDDGRLLRTARLLIDLLASDG